MTSNENQPPTPPGSLSRAREAVVGVLVTRSTASILLDLVGLSALVLAGWLITPWVGLVVLGLGCILAAWAIDPPAPRSTINQIVLDETPEGPRARVSGFGSAQGTEPPSPLMDWTPNQ